MANTGIGGSLSQTVLYLRPTKQPSIAVLDLETNESYVNLVAPPPEPTDISLDGARNHFNNSTALTA
jgi:hypothetical protein